MSKVKIMVNNTTPTLVPSKTSDLNNDSYFVSDEHYSHTDNNYTTEEKTKLAGIDSGAQANVIEVIRVNDSVIDPDVDKAVDIEVPTKTSDLNNDSDFQTGEQVVARITALDAKLDKAIIKRTASGVTASFDDGGDDLPVKALTVNIKPAQSGSGDPSPTNIRPISGWTGAKVTKTGANLLPFDSVLSDGWTNTVDGVTATYNDGVMHISGTHNKSGWSSVVNFNSWGSNPIELPSGITIRTPLSPSDTTIALASAVDGVSKNLVNGSVINAEEKAVVRGFYIAVMGEQTFNFDIPMIVTCGNKRPTAYEPYQSETYSITFPASAGTVYGGTLDVTNGVLTVNMAMVDLGSFDWNKVEQSGYKFFYAGLSNGSRQDNSKCVCSLYKSTESALEFQDNDKICRQYGSTTWGFSRVAIKDSSYNDSTVAEIKTAMSGVQFVYKLATPSTYQLTPYEVNTLLGINNIWADTGDITVTYRADPSIVIENIINAITSLGGNV